jgi:hypothetical protein
LYFVFCFDECSGLAIGDVTGNTNLRFANKPWFCEACSRAVSPRYSLFAPVIRLRVRYLSLAAAPAPWSVRQFKTHLGYVPIGKARSRI